LPALLGAGRTELAHLVIGASPKTSGHVELEGRAVAIRTPGEALDAGHRLSYRRQEGAGLVSGHVLSGQHQPRRAGQGRGSLAAILDRDKAREPRQQRLLRRWASAPRMSASPAGGLSGGNQQKVLLSRLLATTPKVLILDEPTRGVDVGAKSEIYSIIDNLAKSGTAILVISSDLPEIIGICDRVIVMRAGTYRRRDEGGPRRRR